MDEASVPPADEESPEAPAALGARTAARSNRPSGEAGNDREGAAESAPAAAGPSPKAPRGVAPAARAEGQDPELERRVQQELQRVRELMSSSATGGPGTSGVTEGSDEEKDSEAGREANPPSPRSEPPPLARARDRHFPAASLQQDDKVVFQA